MPLHKPIDNPIPLKEWGYLYFIIKKQKKYILVMSDDLDLDIKKSSSNIRNSSISFFLAIDSINILILDSSLMQSHI